MKEKMKRQPDQDTQASELTEAQLDEVVGGATAPAKLLWDLLANVAKTRTEIAADAVRDVRG